MYLFIIVGEMFVVMKNAEINKLSQTKDDKVLLEKTIEELRSKLSTNEIEINKEKKRLQDEIENLKNTNKKYESEKKSLTEKQTSCEKERDQALENYKNMQENNKKLDIQINKLNADLSTYILK